MSKGGNQPSGNTTTTQTNQPWSGAIPYITSGLTAAQNLYDQGGPQYYPGQTLAQPNNTQLTALQNLGNSSQTYSPLFNAGVGSFNSADKTAQNVGNIANGVGNIAGSIAPIVNNVGGTAQNAGNQSSALFDMALKAGNQSYTDNPSSALYSGMAYGDPRLPGMSTLQNFSNGSMLSADNPYFKQMSDNIKAQVLPSLQAPFIGANRGVSGLASRAAGQGLGDAIGGLAYQNYQQGLGQQQSAAQTLAGLTQSGAAGLGGNYAQDLANKYSSIGAAGNAAGLGLNSGNLALGAGNLGIGAGNLGIGAGGLGLNAGNLNLNSAQLLPLLQQMGMTADNQALLAGGQLQGLDQQSINDAVQRWNYQQNLPLSNLQNYISNITAQTGGTGQSSTTQPYFQNQGANALSGALGGGILGSSLASTLSLSSGLGTGLGALAGLAFL